MAQMAEDRRAMFLSSPLTHCRLEMARVSRTQADLTVTWAGRRIAVLSTMEAEAGGSRVQKLGWVTERVLGKPGQQVRPVSK